MKRFGKVFILSSLGLLSGMAQGFEHTKTLPKGIRSVIFRTVHTELNEKTNGSGVKESLEKPLNKDYKFSDAMKNDSETKKNRNRAYLAKEGFNEDDPLGRMNADLTGQVTVFAPIVSYGLSEKFTLAIAIPIYRASMDVELGFEPSEEAQGFLNSLAEPHSNKASIARDQGQKLNDAVGELNQKLADNGFKQLGYWSETGLGDMTLAGKYRFFETSFLKIATTTGAVLPTGRTDDPDNLTDIPFGDGTWDIFSSLSFDQPIGAGFFFNQYGKYTYQAPARRSVRLETDDEAIEVDKRFVDYKMGDKVDAGISLQWESQNGMGAGLGYTYYRKLGDDYKVDPDVVENELEENTDQFATHAEAKVSFSGVPAYRSGAIPVPFSTGIEYKRHLSSINMPVSDLVTFDMAVYF